MKVIATQNVNSYFYKEKLRKVFLFIPYKVQYMLHLLPCTHQDDIQLRVKHFAVKADQFL